MVMLLSVNGGYQTMIDDEDYEELKGRTLRAQTNSKRKKIYVTLMENNKQVSLHRKFLGLVDGDGKNTDHINGDSLDNRRANLRVCTQSENQANIGKRRHNKSGYKGVTLGKGKKRPWVSEIRKDNVKYYLGAHEDIKMAAMAYDMKAMQLYGNFCKLNFEYMG